MEQFQCIPVFNFLSVYFWKTMMYKAFCVCIVIAFIDVF